MHILTYPAPKPHLIIFLHTHTHTHTRIPSVVQFHFAVSKRNRREDGITRAASVIYSNINVTVTFPVTSENRPTSNFTTNGFTSFTLYLHIRAIYRAKRRHHIWKRAKLFHDHAIFAAVIRKKSTLFAKEGRPNILNTVHL